MGGARIECELKVKQRGLSLHQNDTVLVTDSYCEGRALRCGAVTGSYPDRTGGRLWASEMEGRLSGA